MRLGTSQSLPLNPSFLLPFPEHLPNFNPVSLLLIYRSGLSSSRGRKKFPITYFHMHLLVRQLRFNFRDLTRWKKVRRKIGLMCVYIWHWDDDVLLRLRMLKEIRWE